MVKPDGVQRGLIGDIMKRFEQKGFKLVALKFTQPTVELLQQHYADLSKKPFFSGLVKFMATSPVCCMVSAPSCVEISPYLWLAWYSSLHMCPRILV